MKITKAWLVSKGACEAGQTWFASQRKTEASDVLTALIKDEKYDYGVWLVRRVLNRKQLLAFAIFAAEQVLAIFEAKRPSDRRAREAIDAAKAVLANDTAENRAVARHAADAAYAAYAAYAAAYAAARKAMKAAILKYAVQLLKVDRPTILRRLLGRR